MRLLSIINESRKEQIMLKLLSVIGIWLVTVPVFCQSTSKYQVATITEVKTHQAAANETSDVTRYDVSLKVDETIYVVLYTPPLDETTVKYSAGRNLLVLVGKKTITYNDILGRSYEAPIQSQKPAKDSSKAE
jgi:beta-lactam-binding protein with PASTA domain